MKRIILFIVIVITSLQINAQTKVGTIEIEFIVSKMPQLEQVQKNLEAYNSDFANQNKTKLEAYQKLIDTYNQNIDSYNDAEKKVKQDEIISAENEIKKFQENASKLVQIKQEELMQPLYKQIGEALESVAKEEGYSQVLKASNNLVYVDQNYDITLKVMAKLGLPLPEQGN